MTAKILFITLLALMTAACGGVNAVENDTDTVKIGVSAAVSGSVAAYGTPMRNGIELAAEEINAQGGVLGQPIELIEYNNQSDDIQSVQIATQLAAVDNVSLILGADVSSSTKATIQIGEKYKVPVIGPEATGDDVTVKPDGSVEPYGYRIAFQDSYQGQALAQFANENLEATSAVILADNSTDYAVGLSETFTEEFEGEIVAVENYSSEDTDFSAALTKIAEYEFDVLFIPGYYEQGGPIIKQAREKGIDQPILGPDGFGNTALAELAGPTNMNDIYYTTHFTELSEDPRVDKFVENYEAAYGIAPDSFAALGYDAMYMAADAIERARSENPEVLNEYIAQTTDFEGITGTFSFDEMHNPVKSVNIIEIQNGETVNVTEVIPN